MRSIIRKLTFCACLVLAVFMFAKPAQAADLKSSGYFTGTRTFSLDMNHDGKASAGEVKVVTTEQYGYTQTVKIYINGVLARTETAGGSYGVRIQYLKYSNDKEFLYLYGNGDSNMHYFQHMYRYDTASKKLVGVLDLSMYTGACAAISSVASDGSFKISYGCMPSSIGSIGWTYSFKYNTSTKTFKIVNPIATAKCRMTTFDPGDGLTAYFKKNMYKTSMKMNLYTNANQTSVAVTVPKGKFVTLTHIYTKANGAMYAKFKYGSKYGWRLIRNPNKYMSPIFEGVEKRSAGGFFG